MLSRRGIKSEKTRMFRPSIKRFFLDHFEAFNSYNLNSLYQIVSDLYLNFKMLNDINMPGQFSEVELGLQYFVLKAKMKAQFSY